MPRLSPSRMSRAGTHKWARVLTGFGTPTRPRAYEGEQLWLGSSPWQQVELHVPRDPIFLMICPKRSPVGWLFADLRLAREIAIVYTAFPADPRAGPTLQQLHRLASATVFLGDMDPFAIVQYIETRRVLIAHGKPPLLYGGIDDAWLAAMGRSLKRRFGLKHIGIALSKRESALLKRIEEAIDLEALLGPRACSILRSGYKIELEGATNPAIYRPGHGRWAFGHLRSLLRRAAKMPRNESAR